ncbi:MAG: hypothetical protein Q4B26_12105 [Eubacteriales bacterium]|nr:hypothetical protein [Eubacteriales bacterium]
MPRWVYEFSCRDCTQLQEMHQGCMNGTYCRAALLGKTTIHADDDFTLRCDSYTTEPIQQRMLIPAAELKHKNKLYAEV